MSTTKKPKTLAGLEAHYEAEMAAFKKRVADAVMTVDVGDGCLSGRLDFLTDLGIDNVPAERVFLVRCWSPVYEDGYGGSHAITEDSLPLVFSYSQDFDVDVYQVERIDGDNAGFGYVALSQGITVKRVTA